LGLDSDLDADDFQNLISFFFVHGYISGGLKRQAIHTWLVALVGWCACNTGEMRSRLR